jgi:hypothetical protein
LSFSTFFLGLPPNFPFLRAAADFFFVIIEPIITPGLKSQLQFGHFIFYLLSFNFSPATSYRVYRIAVA